MIGISVHIQNSSANLENCFKVSKIPEVRALGNVISSTLSLLLLLCLYTAL